MDRLGQSAERRRRILPIEGGDRTGLGDGDAGAALTLADGPRRRSTRDAREVDENAVVAVLAFKASTDADTREAGRCPILQGHDSSLACRVKRDG